MMQGMQIDQVAEVEEEEEEGSGSVGSGGGGGGGLSNLQLQEGQEKHTQGRLEAAVCRGKGIVFKA